MRKFKLTVPSFSSTNFDVLPLQMHRIHSHLFPTFDTRTVVQDISKRVKTFLSKLTLVVTTMVVEGINNILVTWRISKVLHLLETRTIIISFVYKAYK